MSEAEKRKTEEPNATNKKIKFRNYIPINEELKPLKIETPINNIEETKIEIKKSTKLNLAPNKPDWDLKRDVEKKMSKLEEKTQLVLNDLIKEKLALESDDEEEEEEEGQEEEN